MGMVDIHTHILPSVDDGAASWETALEMCRMAAADGTTHLVATPHANHEYRYERAAHQALLVELAAQVPGLQFSLGCDFHFSYDNLQAAIRHPRRFTIGETPYLLLELSANGLSRNTPRRVFELHAAGMRVILTHPERNPILQRHSELVREFASMGCLLQITANSLLGFWGARARRMAEELLKEGLAQIMASDAHDPRFRPPVLREAVAAASKLVGAARAEALVGENPQAVVAGEEL